MASSACCCSCSKGIRRFVHNAVGADYKLAQLGGWDVSLGCDGVVDVVKLAERGGRPDDFPSPCRPRNLRMATACSTPLPAAISARDCRTVLASRKMSMRGSKSSALMMTVDARPFCVTMRGRCVSRTCEKHPARLLRHSENGTMSSVRRGRRIAVLRAGIITDLQKCDAAIVQKYVQCVNGEDGISRTAAPFTFLLFAASDFRYNIAVFRMGQSCPVRGMSIFDCGASRNWIYA